MHLVALVIFLREQTIREHNFVQNLMQNHCPVQKHIRAQHLYTILHQNFKNLANVNAKSFVFAQLDAFQNAKIMHLFSCFRMT